MNLYIYDNLFNTITNCNVSYDIKYNNNHYINLFELLTSSVKYNYDIIENNESYLDIIIETINKKITYNVTDEMVDSLFNIPTIEEAPRDSRKPITVYVIYNTDLNILTIHKAVRAKFAINIIIEPIKYIQEWKDYCNKVRQYIEKYIYMSTSTIEEVTAEELKEFKLSIINMYILITNKYINIISNNIYNINDKCSECGILISDESFIEINGILACNNCGKERKESIKKYIYSDINRTEISNKIIYENLANFIKRIDAYEGNQKNKPPVAIIRQLIDYFDNNNLLKGKTCNDIRKMATNEEKKKYTSMALLEEALKNTKNTAYYKDMELLSNWVWGWYLNDISKIRNEIIEDYILTQNVYDEIKERESSLNVNLRLIYHLKARGYKCDIKDFKIITSKDSINYHIKMFKLISEKTGIPYNDLF